MGDMEKGKKIFCSDVCPVPHESRNYQHRIYRRESRGYKDSRGLLQAPFQVRVLQNQRQHQTSAGLLQTRFTTLFVTESYSLRIKTSRCSHCSAEEMIHLDAGSIPGLAQWVGDLALL